MHVLFPRDRRALDLPINCIEILASCIASSLRSWPPSRSIARFRPPIDATAVATHQQSFMPAAEYVSPEGLRLDGRFVARLPQRPNYRLKSLCACIEYRSMSPFARRPCSRRRRLRRRRHVRLLAADDMQAAKGAPPAACGAGSAVFRHGLCAV